MGSFTCFVPGHPIVPAAAFQQASEDRWCVDLHAETPINDLAAFVSTPLEPGTALSCFIACAPFEATSWHYLGAISNECPSCLFKLRYVWSARDAMPTHVQFGVQLVRQEALQASPPAEKVSAEVLEAGRRIGADAYEYVTSFAKDGWVPVSVLDKWLTRFNDKCRRSGLDWLAQVAG